MSRLTRLTAAAGTRARRLRHREGLVPGLLSVVVPCYDVEAYLGDCLQSLRAQAYPDVEIVVVDDGSPDGSVRVARAHQVRDPRIRVVRRPNGGLSAARNTGVEHARGEFLTFVDSDDVVSDVAFAAPVAALRDSGSDFALTYYDRLHADGRHSLAGPWIRRAHARRRLGATLESFPEAMVNAVAWSKVYRRSFWDAARLSFPEGRLYEDQPVSMAAFARARAFDVLPEVGVSWRVREDRSSISQALGTTTNLAGHNEAVRASLTVLREAGHPAAVGVRAAQLLANNLPPFTRQLLTGGPDNALFWTLLREALHDLVPLVPRERLVAEVRAQDKVLDELVLADRREDAGRFLEAWGADVRRFPTRVQSPGRVVVDLPCADDVAPDACVLAESQLELAHRVLGAWEEDGDLVLTGWAYLRLVDLAENPPRVAVDLVGSDGRRVALPVESYAEPRADAGTGHWYADYRPGGWRARVSSALLAGLSGWWGLEVTVAAAGVSRTEPVTDVAEGGSAPLVLTPRGGLWGLDVGSGGRPALVGDAVGAVDAAGAVVSGWDVADGSLVLEAVLPEDAGVVLVDAGGRISARGVRRAGSGRSGRAGAAGVSLDLSAPDGRALPCGRYLLCSDGGEGAGAGDAVGRSPLVPSAGLLRDLLSPVVLARHRVELELVAGERPTLALRLGPPLTSDELGARNQRRIREAVAELAVQPDAVFLRPARREGSALSAVCAALGDAAPSLARYWSVPDLAAHVPEGAVPVVEHSRAWHEAFARSARVVVEGHQPDWYAKRPGQSLVAVVPDAAADPEPPAAEALTGVQLAARRRRIEAWDHRFAPGTAAADVVRCLLER